MKKILYIFAIVLLIGSFAGRPAHAQSNADIHALLKMLIAQVQELQRQLAFLQEEEPVYDDSDDDAESDYRMPVVTSIRAKAADEGEIYSGERAYIYGTGLKGKLGVMFDCCKPRASATGWGSSDTRAEFVVPKWEKDGERVAITVVSEAGISVGEVYYVTIRVPNGDDDDDQDDDSDEETNEASINLSSPNTGEAYMVGKPIPVTFDVNGVDDRAGVEVALYHTYGREEKLVQQMFYKPEDKLLHDGTNSISVYPPADLVGNFKLKVSVGEILCCKYWIEATDSDESGTFHIVSRTYEGR